MDLPVGDLDFAIDHARDVGFVSGDDDIARVIDRKIKISDGQIAQML